jgi:hypothetical protein
MLYIDIDHINRIHTSLYFIFIVSIIDCVSSIILETLATSDTYMYQMNIPYGYILQLFLQ